MRGSIGVSKFVLGNVCPTKYSAGQIQCLTCFFVTRRLSCMEGLSQGWCGRQGRFFGGRIARPAQVRIKDVLDGVPGLSEGK